jgi:hypothetical protein
MTHASGVLSLTGVNIVEIRCSVNTELILGENHTALATIQNTRPVHSVVV